MQATIASFDTSTGSGTVLLDDGVELPFDGSVFSATRLRHLRPGQRVGVEVESDTVVRIRFP